MRKLLFILFVLFFITAFSVRKEKRSIPPGTVEINDTFFVDETEIRNYDWLEYEYSIKKNHGQNSDEHLLVLPDTLVWREALMFGQPDVEYYYRHPAYRDYPVVGVSFEQAIQYCKWRTERVHKLIEIKSGLRKLEEIDKPYTGKVLFEYRLPTSKEWEAIATIGPDPDVKKEYLKKNKAFYNLKDTLSPVCAGYDVGDKTGKVRSMLPNRFGIYNLFGNLAEMVSEEGISKGGSWNTFKDSTNVWRHELFLSPNSKTGFRCVCVMKK